MRTPGRIIPWQTFVMVFALKLNLGALDKSHVIPWEQIGAKASAEFQRDGLAVMPTSNGARLHCISQQLDGEATTGGLWLTSTVNHEASDRFQVRAVAVERETGVSPLADNGTVAMDQQNVRFERAGLVEEYGASMDGVRQDFLVTAKPSGNGELELRLAVTGARAEATAQGAQLVLSHSGRKIAYSRLRVTDATGKELPGRIEVRSCDQQTELVVVVDDTATEYPVRIDPTFSDANWISFGGLPGADGTVDVTAVDAHGNLYIGGVFNSVGNTVAHYIAKWDGSTWTTLGQGVDNAVEAFAFSPDGTVYASGAFITAFNSDGTPVTAVGIAKWNGQQWSDLGGGVTGGVFGYFFVHALAVWGTNLYAGGYFSAMGGVSANYIARWNGSAWSAVGSGMDDIVYTLALFDDKLYAGGSFANAGGTLARYVARWDGSSWSALAGGLDYGVNGLAVSGTNLYVGGNFNNAFNSGGATVPAHYVARWDGSAWSAVGTGMNNTVDAVAVAGNTLFAGGIFSKADGASAANVAQWDGRAWSALGSGTSPDSGGGADVRTLATWGTNLYLGGNFGGAGGKISAHVARAVVGNAPGWNQMAGTFLSGGAMKLSYVGYPSTNYALDRTFNLAPPVNWVGQQTNSVTVSGVLLFTNAPAPGSNNFWRVRSVP
jgi:hypothetical protein